MDKQEFSKIALAIKSAYPNFTVLQDNASKDIWYMMLADIPYNIAQPATLELLSTNKYPPSIAEFREKCTSYTTLPTKDYGEAWESVLRAVNKFGYMQELEALESLDEITRRCVKRLGFINICHSENVTADRANFRIIYDNELKHKQDKDRLPMNLQNQKQAMLEQLTETLALEIQGKVDKQPLIEFEEPKKADMDRVSELMKGLKV